MAESQGVSDLKGLADFAGTLVGSAGSQAGTGTGTSTSTGTSRERQEIDQEAINKIIQDVLGQAGGLAAIFQGEQTAGIFGSSVSAQAAGDLSAKLAGEIAKLTAEKVTEQTQAGTQESTQETETEEEGLISGLFGGIKDLFAFDFS